MFRMDPAAASKKVYCNEGPWVPPAQLDNEAVSIFFLVYYLS